LVDAELRRLARSYLRRERAGHTLQTTALIDDLNPLWTPDNRWIIYTSERDGFRNIYRKRVDNRGAPEPILQARQDMNVEDISRDGRMLIFNVRNKRDDTPSLELLSLENAKRTPVTRSASRAARFSPDGRWGGIRNEQWNRGPQYHRR